jgi:hypothetical protein
MKKQYLVLGQYRLVTVPLIVTELPKLARLVAQTVLASDETLGLKALRIFTIESGRDYSVTDFNDSRLMTPSPNPNICFVANRNVAGPGYTENCYNGFDRVHPFTPLELGIDYLKAGSGKLRVIAFQDRRYQVCDDVVRIEDAIQLHKLARTLPGVENVLIVNEFGEKPMAEIQASLPTAAAVH